MPDFLTRRHGTWQFVRRVPAEFAAIEPRRIIQHSTRIRIIDDRTGRRAARVARKFNEELERSWMSRIGSAGTAPIQRYDDVRRQARALGFDYVENDELLALPSEKLLDRLEALVQKGVARDAGARTALLGTEKRPVFDLGSCSRTTRPSRRTRSSICSRTSLGFGATVACAP